MNDKIVYGSIDEYISSCAPEVQEILQKLRRVIQETAPHAKEKISYQMPTFDLHGNLVHFAAFKKHIGFYPAPSGIEAFQDELKEYHTSKGTLQFPIDQPLPYELIRRIVQYRVQQNLEKAESKAKKKR
ncbi:iron chaperone [Bacillus sp. FSL K6-6540]|uniref:iron chaperone n=1 Tax=Bacillus sp. FSL K6-6540 TaxID=2921512 RepID=UPI0030F69376